MESSSEWFFASGRIETEEEQITAASTEWTQAKETGGQKTTHFTFFLWFSQQQQEWRQPKIITANTSMLLYPAVPLQRPTPARAIQPHTVLVSFITPWLFQCGCKVSFSINWHLLQLLLASFHLEEKTKSKDMLVRQTIDVFYLDQSYVGKLCFTLLAVKNWRFIVWETAGCSSCFTNWDICWGLYSQSAQLLRERPVREHPVAVRPFTHPASLWHVAEGF